MEPEVPRRPEFQSLVRVWRQPECLEYTHPHQFLAVHTPNGIEVRPLWEVSAADPLEIPLARYLLQCPPWFPSVTPFRGAAVHWIRVKPTDTTIAQHYNLRPVVICSRLVRHEPAPSIPLGFIHYDFKVGIEETFRNLGPGERSGYAGALVVISIYDFLDGRRITVYGYLELDIASTYVKWQAFHCEDLLRTYPGLFAYTLSPRIPVDPFSYISVHPETIPL